MIVDVNGKRGSYRLRPVAGENLDERQANTITLLRAVSCARGDPVSVLRKGANEISLSFLGDTGIVNYDALWLERGTAPAQETERHGWSRPSSSSVRRAAQGSDQVVLRHMQPLAVGKLSMKVGAGAVTGNVAADGFDFWRARGAPGSAPR
jgi:hypothetical protein